jgi:uncharacterized membrane protein
MNLKKIVISGIIMLLLDSVYLSTFSNYFNQVVTSVQGKKIKFNLIGAIFCYAFLIGGLNYFILDRNKSWHEAMLLGLIIYGVYETTNYTIFSNWTLGAVVLDTCWGAILFALTTFFTRYFYSIY